MTSICLDRVLQLRARDSFAACGECQTKGGDCTKRRLSNRPSCLGLLVFGALVATAGLACTSVPPPSAEAQHRAAAALPAVAQPKSVLVVAAHPDDEVLLAAGRSRTALSAGDQIKIVIVTNGDIDGVDSGLQREGESVASAQALGLTEQDVIFMGYPDGATMNIYNAADTTLITSAAGQTATYGNRGLGGMDYHKYKWGAHGSYTRATARSDFESLLTDYQPDEIYTHSDFEVHSDHQATAMFITDALASLRRKGINLQTKLYQSIVWMPTDTTNWPQIDPTGWTPTTPFLPDTCPAGSCLDGTPMEWARLIHFDQPPEMLVTDPALNMKELSLPLGVRSSWFDSFVRKDEFFWVKDFGTNMATTATVTASSQDVATGQTAAKAVDGIIKGISDFGQAFEWATQNQQNQLAGAWIQLDWSDPMRISQVNLWSRIRTGDDVLAGTLLFSDGSEVAVGALPATGRVMPVQFAPKTVSWVRFRVDQAEGSAVGLTEIQALGAPASSSANLPPHFLKGPSAASQTIPASQSTNISVEASDLDGDPLTYTWTAESGSITGSGATVLYTPPAVSETTWFTVSVTVSDGRGGSATNSTYVQVTQAPTSSVSLTPTLVFGGDSVTGSILLATPAPAGGLEVMLASDRPSVAAVPASVTVPAGESGTTFPVTTTTVSAATLATITADFSEGPRSATLSLVPVSVTSLALAPANVLGGIASQGTVTLPAPAGAAGVSVNLTSSDPSTATVPTQVMVPAGATAATFSVSTIEVAVTTGVTISASWGTTATAVLTVGPLAVSALSFAPNPVQGGNASQGTVTLNGPAPTGGTVVALASSDPNTAVVPAEVTVPAGNSTATFAVNTITVASATPVTVTASYVASTATNTLTVSPYVPPPSSPNLISNPEQIGGTGWDVWGTSTSLSVTLNYATAPDGSNHATRAVSDGESHALAWQAHSVTPNETYTFSFFAKNNGGSAASYSVYDQNNVQDIIAPTSYTAQISSTAFTRVTVTFTVPAGCTEIIVYPLRDSGGPVDVLLWGAKLEVGSTATGYDGLGMDHTITASAPGGHGSITPASVVVVGGSPSGDFTITAEAGYHLLSLTDNGIDVTGSVVGGKYSIASVIEGHSLLATFAADAPPPEAGDAGPDGGPDAGVGTMQYSEDFESGVGGWADSSGTPPVLASDATSASGPGVMTVARATAGGDYFSPAIAVTGGQTYCVSAAVKWSGGGAPFVGLQPSTSTVPIWLIGASGYQDAFGPVQAVSASETGWQEFQYTVVMPAEATQAWLNVELFSGVTKPGGNLAYFDGFAISEGACVPPTSDAGVSADSSVPPVYSIPYVEQFESGTGGWSDRSGASATLASDGTSPAGSAVLSVARATAGGDYFSPAITVTGGQTYCVSAALKWSGGGAPFVGLQPSTSTVPIWLIGASGYQDAFGPVQAVSASETGWQEFQYTVVMPAEATQARLNVELFSGESKPGENLAYFDGFAITDGACVYSIPYVEQFESGTGGWSDRSGASATLASDGTSPAGASVLSVARATGGGDYFSPAITVTGGQTYCVSAALKWSGGGTPFVGLQPSTSTVPIWLIGASGYQDAFGPVQAVSASETGWQEFQYTVVMPAEVTQAWLNVELFSGESKPGENLAYFDGFAITEGACVYSIPYVEQFESGTGGWSDRSGASATLASDGTSPAGASVLSVARATGGGDYFSPAITVTGGQTYCVSAALKWSGGGTPFVGLQPSTSTVPYWLIGASGYQDAFGPVQAVSTSETGWQQFQYTVVMPAEATQARLNVELFSGVTKPGENAASFDGFSLTSGACAQSLASPD